jgi:hypothetical protein
MGKAEGEKRKAETMTDQEIIAGLATIGSEHPAWRAFAAVLADAVTQEQDNVTAPNLTDGARHFNAGRLALARDLGEAMQRLRAEADATLRGNQASGGAKR